MFRLHSFVLAACVAPFIVSPHAAAQPAKRPNVLIVMTDDQGLGDFSFTGNPVLKTPHFDAFAKESVRLTDFHVCPMCSPTRGQLMTGLAALRNGATSVTAGRTFLRPGLPTMPEAFAAAGYQTGLFGKWHLGDSHPHRPIDKGFRESVYHLGWGQLHSTPEFDWPLTDGRYFHNGVEKRYKGHCTDFWFDSAMAWMKACQSRNEPFFCYLPTNAPHAPHLDREEFIAPYRGKGHAGFFGMIAHLDARFGDLDRFLTDQKLRDDTIVVFMTDNGGTAGVATFNAGLRAGKTTYYDGGHRVPCWVRWPNGQLGPPRDIDTPTQNTDLFPTLCDFCGVPKPQRPPADERYAGTSLAGLLRGTDKTLPTRTLVVQYGQVPAKHEACVIRGPWRLVKGTELFDVSVDRAQKTDLAARDPFVVASLREEYEAWWKGVEPTLNDFVPVSLGAEAQPVVELNSGDWENIYADNTGFVREAVGGPTGGTWHVTVERPGTYEFTLRRWPEQTKAALGDKYEPSEKSPANKAKVKTVGFPTIAKARLAVAGKSTEASADPKATSATLSLSLPVGTTTLKAWFADANGKDLCGAFFVTVRPKEDVKSKRPNVVIVLVDDFGWGDPSCYGNMMVKTPQIDRLASEGVRFTQGYVAAPICSPSRCGIITGQFPARHRITSFLQTKAGNRACEMADFLDPKAPSLPRMLKKAGYATAHVGKWHLGGGRDVTEAPKFAAYGYDVGLGTYESPEPAAPLGLKTTPWGPQDKLEPQQVPRHKRTEWMVDQTLSFLKSNAGKPCFVNLWLDDTHTPFVPSAEAAKAAKVPGDGEPKTNYKAVLTEADRQVGRLLDGLKGTNTLVLFLGDNGASQPLARERGGGLRGQKLSLYEGGIRVPFVAWWPGYAKPGVNESTVIASVDFLSTLATICGATLPAGYSSEGEDMTAALKGEISKRTKPLFWEYGRNTTSFAYPQNEKHKSPNLAVRDGNWKLLVNADGTGAELYDVVKDRNETNDMARTEPAVTKRLKDAALAWRRSMP